MKLGHARLLGASLALCLLAPLPVRAADSPSPTKYVGTVDGGGAYEFFVPKNWNGTLFFYSRGYHPEPNNAQIALDPWTREWLLDHGFALAGGAYPCGTCWEPTQMYPSQIKVLDKFDQLVGHPTRTIAWGHSFGGGVTAQLVRFHPDRFAGALPMCAFRAEGGVGNFNERLDHAFVLKTLLGFDQPLVNIGLGRGQLTRFLDRELAVIDQAQLSAAGRARLALAEAMVNTPDWGADFDQLATEPAATDFVSRQHNQYLIARGEALFADGERAFDESRIGDWDQAGDGSVRGGNFSWNTGVDYARQLQLSEDESLVRTLYDQAGVSLDDDLVRLRDAPRIGADPGAVAALEAIDPIYGDIGNVQIVTLSGEGDAVVFPNEAQGYAEAADAVGKSDQLRELFVHRAGHCAFTSAEEITAIQTLLTRLDTGAWPSTSAPDINERASSLGSPYNKVSSGRPVAPAFDDSQMPLFLRNFNTTSTNPYP